MRPHTFLRTILVLAALLPASAFASVVLPASVESLARQADLVVRGRAERAVCVASPDGKQLHTVTTVRVASALKGEAGQTVEVRTPGGTLGDLTQVVHGAPSFSQGEEVVLFLHREHPARYTVESLALGKFEVVKAADGAPVVRQRAAKGLAVLQPDGKVVPAQEVSAVPERDFLERVRRAVDAARGGR